MSPFRPFASSSSVTAALLLVVLNACGSPPAEAEESDQSAAITESGSKEALCHGIVALDFSHYTPTGPNVGRELAESLDVTFVHDHAVAVPGVLRARYSFSPYDYASVLELRGWSTVTVGSFSAASSDDLFVRISGPETDNGHSEIDMAKTLFEALTRATETTTPSFTERRSRHGSVVCQRWGGGRSDSYQCTLGPTRNLSPLETNCP